METIFAYFKKKKRLAKKLYVRDDELFIKELEFYQTLEDLIKATNGNAKPPNI